MIDSISNRVKVNWSYLKVGSSTYEEPFFDYDDDGEPREYDFDKEPEDIGDVDAELNYVYDVSPHEFVETAINIGVKGKIEKFSFERRPYLTRIYDTGARQTLLKWGRQTEKSTSLGNKLLGYCCLNNYFQALYVSSSAEQAKVFSNDRIADPIKLSPTLGAYTTSKLTNAVFHKKFLNFSQLRVRYAYLNADRTRGIPADLICIDEIQDINVDNIPIIEECASHSAWKIFIYSGTPKSLDNTIEVYWDRFSTQNEWVIPCEHHGTPKDPSSWYWNILGEKNISENGLVCDKCGNNIWPTHPSAQWASMNPITENNKDKITFEGYRVPQIMVPWIVESKVEWKILYNKYKRYPRQRFFNECLGLSYDSGVKPIKLSQLKSACVPSILLSDYEYLRSMMQGKEVYAGIDWGSGENSYTVLSLGAYLSGKFTVFWVHRYDGEDLEPEVQILRIMETLTQFNFTICGADYGGGFDKNSKLIRAFGPKMVFKYQYNFDQKKGKLYWEDKLGRFAVHRTEVMNDVFQAIMRKEILLPSWDQFENPYGRDILNIFSEEVEVRGKRMTVYKKSPSKTDDAFHSILYCFLASTLKHPRPDILTPRKEQE